MVIDGSRPPRWHELLAIGFDRLLDVRRYGWYLAASVALTVALGLLADQPGGLLLGLMLVTVDFLTSVVLSRQMMTGRLSLEHHDFGATARLLGLFALVMAVGILLVSPLSPQPPPDWLSPLTILVQALVLARLGFYLPALALSDPTSVRDAFVQGRPFSGRLTILCLITTVPVVTADWALTAAGTPFAVAKIILGIVAFATGVMFTAALSYLYWTQVR